MRVIGVRGGTWRARVDASGTVLPGDGSPAFAWHVAGEDRWYSPASEPTTRQEWLGGFPVVETRMRVGGGDVVQRAWCVADHGGLTLVEFTNETPVAVAVAVTRGDVITTRPVPPNPPVGIDLPTGSVVLPLAHRSTLRVALAHGPGAPSRLPDGVPDHQQVLRGWEAACAVASRISVPDPVALSQVAAVRSGVLLGSGVDGLQVEAVRLGESHGDSVVDVVGAVQRRLRDEKRARTIRWDTRHLLATAARACVLLDDEVAAGDIGASWLRIADRPTEPVPAERPDGPSVIAWLESTMAAGSPAGGHCTVLPAGVPETWWGASFEAHGLVGDPVRTLSYAVRWHGERPALLWEVTGPAGLVLDSGSGGPVWHTVEPTGETLLSAPRGAHDLSGR